MIYTLTVNPAIDYHMDLTGTGFRPGEINRSAKEDMYPGGKGLNVSVLLAQLGMVSIFFTNEQSLESNAIMV